MLLLLLPLLLLFLLLLLRGFPLALLECVVGLGQLGVLGWKWDVQAEV
jgi:hypothetical protein